MKIRIKNSSGLQQEGVAATVGADQEFYRILNYLSTCDHESLEINTCFTVSDFTCYT